jgi:hypothetical protein
MSPPRPGLAKIRAIPLTRVRRVELVGATLPRLVAMVDDADVVSEGREVAGARGRAVYFGSTSVLLRVAADELARREVLTAVAGDLHLRALLVRRARAEAAARASGPVGTARAELSMRIEPGAIAFVVDVEVDVAIAAHARR